VVCLKLQSSKIYLYTVKKFSFFREKNNSFILHPIRKNISAEQNTCTRINNLIYLKLKLMKKILFTAAAAMFFLISCKDSSGTSTATGSTDSSQSDKNLANNRKVYKAIETGDMSSVDTLIANDAVDHEGENGRDTKGGDSIKHMLGDMHNHIKDFKMDVVADAANGDYIFSMVHMAGTITDPYMGMTAGQKMDENSVDVIKVKDGKMVEHWGFVDPNVMMKQMQAMPMSTMPMDSKMKGKMDSSKMKK
jgi:ketosteroid isomerase-like protein